MKYWLRKLQTEHQEISQFKSEPVITYDHMHEINSLSPAQGFQHQKGISVAQFILEELLIAALTILSVYVTFG